jgi:hypothetical protein
MHHQLKGMWMRVARLGLALLAAGVLVSCGDNSPKNPVSPTSPDATGGEAAPDGSTLKASIPGPASPVGGVRVDTRRPPLVFSNSTAKFAAAGTGTYTYRVELLEGTTTVGTFTLPQASGAQSTFTPAEDLKFNTAYRWRVRAELGAAFTAWSAFAEFTTPLAPTTSSGGVAGGPVGPARSIGLNEAFGIILAVHNGERWNLGSASTREQRVEFLWRAVGIIHFGHPIYNPAGGDRDWCVKDAGGGRPPSDDVLVTCGSRDAWDLIGGAGANGYSFHLDYLGRLGSDQNVYPPPVPGGGGVATLPPDPNRPALPDVRGLIQSINAERPELLRSQSCPQGLKYINNPWQDFILDRLRAVTGDPRWGYNAKPTRTANDNNGVPVIAAGDEIAYYYGSGNAQGSDQVYLIDILEGHCGSNPNLTWRVFTGEEPGRWTSAGRF